MLNKKIEEAFNEQINAELFSSYLYLSMAAWFEGQNLDGAVNWFKVQAQEEVSHAMKFFHFIAERGGSVQLKAIDGPETKWESPLAAFQAAYDHELKVSALINKLVDLAIKEGDHASNGFLQWFVSEQVEEEKSADDIVQKLKLVEKAPGGLFMVDRELAQRTFTPPAAGGEA